MSDSTWLGAAARPADPTQSTGLIAGAARTPIDPTTPTRLADPTPTRPTDSTQIDSKPKVDPSRPDSGRDWVVDFGLTLAGLAAVAASFSALKDLAALAGWGKLDWLLWITIDVYAFTASRVWLSSRTTSRKVRRFAAANALGAIALSVAGNAAYHAIHAGAWHLGSRFWMLVVVVSAVPPAVIGLIGHLAVLRSRDTDFAASEAAKDAAKAARESTRPAESTDPIRYTVEDPTRLRVEETAPVDPAPSVESTESTRPEPKSTAKSTHRPDPTPEARHDPPDPDDPDPLLDRARELDREHQKSTNGPRIGADRLREELGVGSARARALRDAVRGLHGVSERRAG